MRVTAKAGIPPHEYRDDVKPARNEEALHLLRTDPAEYFRRTWNRQDDCS